MKTENELIKFWHQILVSEREPITGIRGKTSKEWTPLYTRLFKRKGGYILRKGEAIPYLGKAGDALRKGEEPIEGGLADRLWAHYHGETGLARKLAALGINLQDCDIQVWFEEDSDTRHQIEQFGIKTYRPVANTFGKEFLGNMKPEREENRPSESRRPPLIKEGLGWYAEAVTNSLSYLKREGFSSRPQFIGELRPLGDPGRVDPTFIQWCLVALGITPQVGHEEYPIAAHEHKLGYATNIARMQWWRSLSPEQRRKEINHYWNVLWGSGRLPYSL